MDGIKINPVAIQTIPTAKGRQAPVLPKPSSGSAPIKPEPRQAEFDVKTAEQRRYEAVQQAARQAIANTFVVSDTTFSLFKDSTGQYITRITSLRDGKVTYIPEPDLLKLGGSSAASLSIKV